MKITPWDYAAALYEATQEKSEAESEQIVKNLVKVLRENHHLDWERKIIAAYYRYFREKKHIARVVLTSQAPLPTEIINKVVKVFADQVEIEERIDANIQGGIILEINQSFLLDGSVKHKLERLRARLTSI